MLTKKQLVTKRLFDILLSFLGLVICFLPITVLMLLATIFTKKSGLFMQERIGQNAKPFTIYKIRSMEGGEEDMEVTTFGKFLRSSKLDELPQLYNVLIGDMSLVGPRPDVKGYADELKGEDQIILSVKPGITGPATLKYSNEDALLAKQPDPKEYNDTVIWKDKVEINKEYIKNWSFIQDLNYLIKTIFS